MNTYPMKFKSNSAFVEELFDCEYGRYEDAKCAREENDTESIEANDYQVVFCDFGNRHKAQIEVRNDAELVELYYALGSGTVGLYKKIATNNMMDKIRPYVEIAEGGARAIELWPYNQG